MTQNQKPVRLYTTSYCGYCRSAEALLRRRGIPFESIDCTDDTETREWLVRTTGRTTVPQIFVGDVAIGGYTDLARLERSGELDRMLAAA